MHKLIVEPSRSQYYSFYLFLMQCNLITSCIQTLDSFETKQREQKSKTRFMIVYHATRGLVKHIYTRIQYIV